MRHEITFKICFEAPDEEAAQAASELLDSFFDTYVWLSDEFDDLCVERKIYPDPVYYFNNKRIT